MELSLPPLDGSLLTLVNFVDFHAEHNPDRPWLVYPSPSSNEGLASVTFKELATATHLIASTLRPGRQGSDDQVVAILLHTDNVVYVAVMLGLLRAGLIPFPMSPRNSVQGICHLIQATNCRRTLYGSTTAALVKRVNAGMKEQGVELQLDELSVLKGILSDLIAGNLAAVSSFEPYPASRTPVDLDAPMLYLHSSGSTGLPKAIPFKQEQALQSLRRNIFGSGHRKISFGGMGLPAFHSMGMLSQVFVPLSTLKPTAVYAPQYPAPPVVPSPASILEVNKLAKCEGLIATPSFIEGWSHSPESVDYLKTLEVVLFGGGPLSVTVGDKLVAAGVPLYPGFGGSEFGNPTKSWDEIPPSELRYSPDWSWFRFSDIPNVQLESQGDGTYELVVYETDEYKVRVYNILGQKGYATADLFESHPTNPDLWRIVGRKDDVIILSTGEKVVPLAQEGYIISSPLVAGCVMFGREREQAGVLVEPNPAHAIDPNDSSALAEFRNKLWPTVEEANAEAPSFARIFKEMIIVTDPKRPPPRSPKNTIIRKQATGLYVKEIDDLYSTVEQSRNVEDISLPGRWDVDSLIPWLLDITHSVADKQPADPAENLFHQGFDSLSATFFRNRIIGALRSSPDPTVQVAAKSVSSNFVFEHPTIRDLAATLASFAVRSTDSNPARAAADTRRAEIDALVAKYTADMPIARTHLGALQKTPPVVLLTGSTGNIGSHILAALLTDSHVHRVYTLNRPSSVDAIARLKAAFRERKLPVELLNDIRLVCLEGDASRKSFGLVEQVYEDIVQSVTHIVHNAWTVNFNLPVSLFEDQIAGVRKLVDISASAGRPVKLLVTSSIGVARGWDSANGPVPERPLSDLNVEASSGYASSKYVVEKILQVARDHGLPVMTVRMGQACGPKATGAWGTTEWFPIMVKSSIALDCFPALSGPVAWVPLDAIGRAYGDWILGSDDLPALVNVVHPRPTSWEVVLKGIREELDDDLQTIPLLKWLWKLESQAEHATLEDLKNIPALKMLDFFRGLSSPDRGLPGGASEVEGVMSTAFDTAELQRSTANMRAMQPMTEEYARSWVKFWKANRFIGDKD